MWLKERTRTRKLAHSRARPHSASEKQGVASAIRTPRGRNAVGGGGQRRRAADDSISPWENNPQAGAEQRPSEAQRVRRAWRATRRRAPTGAARAASGAARANASPKLTKEATASTAIAVNIIE